MRSRFAHYYPSDPHIDLRMCDCEGCESEGKFPAPKIRQMPASLAFSARLGYQTERDNAEKYWFCKQHVRQYNQRWDFFADMSGDEIDAFRADAVTGHRKVQAISGTAQQKLYADAMFWRGDGQGETPVIPPIPEGELQAMAILGLTHPLDIKLLKKRYRTLVKRYHPDKSGVESAEKFKQVNEAYHLLRESAE